MLVTTGQPSCDPRIVKEADAFHAAGYDVILLYCFFIPWASEKDAVTLQQVRWKYKITGGSPYQHKVRYLFTRLRFITATFLHRYFGNISLLAERSQARAYDELLSEAKKIKASWYIGHNLGALPVVVKAAAFNRAKAGFDFEDYHRGEIVAGNKRLLQRIIFLENKYLPSLAYFSTSSTMITKGVLRDHPCFTAHNITVLNCFPLKQQPEFKRKDNNDKLRLFWFSQTIGPNRGLEIVLQALQKLNDPTIDLTLAGLCSEAVRNYIGTHASKIISRIHLAGIIQPEDLPVFSSQFDVGVATELTVPENRDLCLTNKIFTYLLAGNAIILSETSMQVAFNNTYKVGESFPVNDVNALAEKIKDYKNTEKLNRQKLHNYQLAKSRLHWEKESEKLLTLFN